MLGMADTRGRQAPHGAANTTTTRAPGRLSKAGSLINPEVRTC